MTAPLFHLEPGALAGASAGAEVVFGGPEARHAAAAMRLAPGVGAGCLLYTSPSPRDS